MTSRRVVIVAVLIIGGFVAAWRYWSRHHVAAAADDGVTFKRANPDYGRLPTVFSIQIDGGLTRVPTANENFPSAFWADNGCSSTLIGDQVLLTARHCVVKNPNINISLPGHPAVGTCETASAITGGKSNADFALCRMDVRVKGIVFETLASAADAVKGQDEILLTGWGGSDTQGLPLGTFLMGPATVDGVTGGVVTTTAGDVWLQEGDSGGAAYRRTQGKRRLVAVNSSVEKNRHVSHAAYLVDALNTIRTWKMSKRDENGNLGLWICGLDQNAMCQP